ncbi:Lrp/AsnC family transcriptional regulator [Brevibacterium sp.]|uniref:Lrp/AsnC family transcriptional regulator n=1 Tax=Brevibacterium sp. TaxID=1701 RepID=UPI0025B90EAE|nr:Lrp/AsnC family transcriptional regulator [Brevibacterium sp.]
MPERDTAGAMLLSEEDMALVDAMQINPRISWGELSAVLDADASTIARRWNRLKASGAAWTTVMPGSTQTSQITVAYIQIDCEVDRWRGIVDWLFAQPHVVTVQHLSGELTLWCAVFAPSEMALSEYVVSILPSVPGIRKIRTNIATRVFDSSRQWRLKVLSRREAEKVQPESKRSTATHDFDRTDRRLFSLLAVDARTPTSVLAERLGISQRSVQRRINYLVNSGDVEFRCDLARSLAGWQSGAILWIDVPEAAIEQVGRDLVNWEETRSCAAIAGMTNLMLTTALHTAKDLYSFTRRLTAAFPEVTIADRQIVLRQYKLYGHILSPTGQKTATAEVDPWYLSGA